MALIEGTAWVFGDNIDTDVIMPGKYLVLPLAEAAEHVMSGIRPGFASMIADGDVVVAGENFGAGSSREVAPQALLMAGIKAVVAPSFARIFFRNSINIGLVPVVCSDAALIEEGQRIRVDLASSLIEVVGSDRVLPTGVLPDQIRAIVESGGLVEHLRKRLGEEDS